MIDDLDDLTELQLTRAGVAYLFGLTPAAVADLEKRGVLVFDDDDEIDVAKAAAKIFSEGRLLQRQALGMIVASSKLIAELSHRLNSMFDILSEEPPSPARIRASLTDTVANYQRIIDDLTAVMKTPMGTQEQPRREGRSSCALN